MKYLFLAAVFAFAAACAATDSTTSNNSAGPQAPNYNDARATASDAEVRDARRAFRAACGQNQSAAYCECMTGGMAQALAPQELAVATAAFTGQTVTASQQTRDHVAAVRTDVDRGCAQFRRG